jgi:hypothetical protein
VRKTTILLMLLALLVLSACQPLAPVEDVSTVDEDLRRVSGEIYMRGVPQWGGVTVSMDFDFAELDPETHEATGYIDWHNVMPNAEEGTPTWKGVESEARYIFFGEDVEGGEPDAVVVITQIASKGGWGQGEPGQYGYFWFSDGGEAGPDQWGMRYYSFDPFQEFYPADSPPVDDGYFTAEDMHADGPVLPLDVELGDIELSRPAP